MLASSPEARSPYALPHARPLADATLSPPAVAARLAPPALALVCAAAGALVLLSSVRALAGQWRSDDLKSMGLLVPFISFALLLRAWRTLGWSPEGSWWGVVLLGALASLLFVRDQSLLIITLGKSWLLQVPPLPVVAILYAFSLALLLGGMRLVRRSWFPIALMAAVIPVPQFFSHRVDLPLQHVSAAVARSFAHLLGEKLTPDHLRLMFTPEFGMFIAPGCNGIRGAVTLGLAAVVIAHLYRFRWYVAPPVVATLALAAVFGLDTLHAQRSAAAHMIQLPPMPATLGSYRLVRTYEDTLLDGVVVYAWGEYAPVTPGGPHIALGVAPELEVHDAEVCHIARGEEPTSHSQLTVSTVAGEVALVAATYNNGTVHSLEASTVCDGGQCGQFTQSAGGATLVYAHPHRELPMQWAPSRPVPILLKVEDPQGYLPVGTVAPRMTAALRDFLSGVNLAEIASQYRGSDRGTR